MVGLHLQVEVKFIMISLIDSVDMDNAAAIVAIRANKGISVITRKNGGKLV